MDQSRKPFVEALVAYEKQGFWPYHTPGHKRGQAAGPQIKAWMGEGLPLDLGVMYALDDLHEPEGALAEAQALCAELYGSEECFFSINGTTSLIQTMIWATVGPGDKIIIPRDAHRSVMGGLVMSGATPVYLETRYDSYWGVPKGPSLAMVQRCLEEHGDAKAIVLVHPNYYGIASDLASIIKMAHKRGIMVLVDEAHGVHLPFNEELPRGAVDCGADMVAQSTHKLGPSVTQTSWLHVQGPRVDRRRVRQVFQMLQSTSPQYLFLASLDEARWQLARDGKAMMAQTLSLARQCRKALSSIEGISVMDKKKSMYALDETKIVIDARALGFVSGGDFECMLRQEGIEVELIVGAAVLVLITMGDTAASIGALVSAVRRVAKDMKAGTTLPLRRLYGDDEKEAQLPKPKLGLTPREAFHREAEIVDRAQALGRVSKETITYYPPGIPFVAMGEVITEEVLDYVARKKALGFKPNGAADSSLNTWMVCAEKDRERLE